LKNSVIQLSIKHSVLSPYTAFLVLETNQIDPPVSGIGDQGVSGCSFALSAAYPNPFDPAAHSSLSIPFDADGRSAVRIIITDALGRIVRVVTEGVHAAGRHVMTWDGTNASGQRVASGVYFVRMTAGRFSAVRQIILR
jgi:hypothetical protein